MSAVTKPLARFTSAKTSHQKITVPVEHVLSVEPLDQPAIGNDKAKYFIIFNTTGSNFPKKIEIEFTTSSARDTSLTNFLSTFVTSVA